MKNCLLFILFDSSLLKELINPYSFTSFTSSPSLLSLSYELVTLGQVNQNGNLSRNIWKIVLSLSLSLKHTNNLYAVLETGENLENLFPHTHTHSSQGITYKVLRLRKWVLESNTPRFKSWNICCFLAL